MNYLYIGKIVNTHGIKGEIRILSKFKFKDKALKIDNKIYIGKEKKEEVINSYRKHKNFDMITLKGYDNINQVLKYKNENIYINKEDLVYVGYLDEDLIGLDVYLLDKNIGIVDSIEYIKNNSLIIVKNNLNKKIYIPNNKEFIKSIDVSNNKVYINYVEGLIE